MLQEALTKTESLDSLPVRNDSATSSQSSMAEHGPPEGNGVQHSLYMYRSRLRSDSGAESMSDTPPTPPEGTPFIIIYVSLCTSLLFMFMHFPSL